MDKHNEGMVATWTGTAMTLFTALAGFGVLLYPERRLLWVLVALFAVGAVLSFIQVFRIHRRAKRTEATSLTYTSDGLAWRTLAGGFSRTAGYQTLINVHPDDSGGQQLPQPLILRVTCSREPTEAWGTFYSDSRNLNSRHLPSIWGSIEGRIIKLELRDPKLRPPSMLAISARGETEDEITIERVERQR